MRQGDLVGLIESSSNAEKQLLSSLGSSIDLGPLLCECVPVCMCVAVCVLKTEKGERQEPL